MDFRKQLEDLRSSFSSSKPRVFVVSAFCLGLIASLLVFSLSAFLDTTPSVATATATATASSLFSWVLSRPGNSSRTYLSISGREPEEPHVADFNNNRMANSTAIVSDKSQDANFTMIPETKGRNNSSSKGDGNGSENAPSKKKNMTEDQLSNARNYFENKFDRQRGMILDRAHQDSTENNASSFQRAPGDISPECDIFNGRWVTNERGKPYYPAGSCPYIDIDFDCHKNGRPDDDFLRWKWQPYGCNIPSLNATDFLERLRGKRLIFVGDSLNRNMWESLVCILRHSVGDKKKVYEASGRTKFKTSGYYSFKFEDYNCSVDFVRSTFLVKELYVKAINGSEDEKLRLDLLDETTRAYRDAEIVVFNTGHWWTHEKTSRGMEYYQEGNYVYPRLKVMEAYKKALTTWATWVDKHIDHNKTQVVFRGYSLTHFRGGQWNSGGQCHKEIEPIFNETYLAKYPSKMKALEHVLHQMETPVLYLNISRLTDYRKDAHPSIYRKEYTTAEEQATAEKTQDCSHWCLPGVPDTWNQLLYVSLLMHGKGSWKR